MVDQPIRMHVRGSSSAVEYAKKSFSLDPVDQISNFTGADTKGIKFLGERLVPCVLAQHPSAHTCIIGDCTTKPQMNSHIDINVLQTAQLSVHNMP